MFENHPDTPTPQATVSLAGLTGSERLDTKGMIKSLRDRIDILDLLQPGPDGRNRTASTSGWSVKANQIFRQIPAMPDLGKQGQIPPVGSP